MSKIKLLGLTKNEIKAIIENNHLPSFTTSQILNWIYKHHINHIDDMTNLSKKARETLDESYSVGANPPEKFLTSKDGTIKYLFRTETNEYIETVYIPDHDRATLCVSCQVGCKMGCKFCMTGKQGWSSSLSTFDIINQVFSISESDKLTNIVFMGQGEPLDNIDNVLKAIEILTSDWGFGWSPKRITVSSVGLPNIEKLIQECKCNIAISLHHPTPESRKEMMPAENGFSIRKTIEILKKYDFASQTNKSYQLGEKQRRLSFEYIIFKGINDSIEDAKKLLALLKGIDCRINLIKFHTIPDTIYEGVDDDKMIAFRNYLTKNGIFSTVRASRGEDIFAACGLLTTKYKTVNNENKF